MELQRILVPYDFSESSQYAALYAGGLAERFDSEVTLMHVLPPLRYEFAMTEPSDDRLKEVNQHRIANAARALENVMPAVRTGAMRCEIVEGDAAAVTIAAANEFTYDAIVMSTRGAGALRRWFTIGSVTSKVLHEAERPVITSVHFENHEPPVLVRKVIAAIDLGPQSLNVACWAVRAARSFGAKLEIAHVATPVEAAIEGSGNWQNRARERAFARIEDLKRNMNLEAEAVVEFGQPARVLSDLARTRGADLLVLGRGVSQDLLGRLRANAYDIIRQCPCPVVSI